MGEMIDSRDVIAKVREAVQDGNFAMHVRHYRLTPTRECPDAVLLEMDREAAINLVSRIMQAVEESDGRMAVDGVWICGSFLFDPTDD